MTDPFLAYFSKIWKGGFFEGDPRNPMAHSSYGIFGFISTLHVVYLTCIKNYVANRVVIEIGPGRGAWTKAIAEQGPKHIYAVDAAPPEHTRFWDYIGRSPDIDYIVAQDFSLDGVPDGTADYFFSFGCFCHLKPEMCIAYFNSLSKKMKSGAHGFVMIADFDKYNYCYRHRRELSLEHVFARRRYALVRAAYYLSVLILPKNFLHKERRKDSLPPPEGGGWYHLGVPAACEALERAGFRVIERDMGVNHRDPIIHFVRA